jgi:hypothetical protein
MANRSKKHASKKQLDYLSKFTSERLVAKGIIESPENSVIDKIKQTAGAPMLPGLRSYLPTPLLINIGRRALLDFGREWQLDTKDIFTQSKLDEFFKFTVKRLNSENFAVQKIMNARAAEINDAIAKDSNTEAQTVGQWLKPQDIKDLSNAMSVFVIDAFAVAVASRSASETPEFLEWFLHWTSQLLSYWPVDIRSQGANIFNGQTHNAKDTIQRGHG